LIREMSQKTPYEAMPEALLCTAGESWAKKLNEEALFLGMA